MVASATSPNITASRTAAMTAIGRSIARRIRFISGPGVLGTVHSGAVLGCSGISDCLARAQPLVAAHHHQVTGLQAVAHLEPAPDRLAQLHRPQRRRMIFGE